MNEVLSILLNPLNYVIPIILVGIMLWVFVKLEQRKQKYVNFLMKNINNKKLKSKRDIRLAFQRELSGEGVE